MGQEEKGTTEDEMAGWNPERPPRNSHGDWPFLRPPDHVPEVPIVSREHLPQLAQKPVSVFKAKVT